MKITKFKTTFQTKDGFKTNAYDAKYFKNVLDMRENQKFCLFELEPKNVKRYKDATIFSNSTFFLVEITEVTGITKVKKMSKSQILRLFN